MATFVGIRSVIVAVKNSDAPEICIEETHLQICPREIARLFSRRRSEYKQPRMAMARSSTTSSQ